ncbi:MAG TPA: hypothetical protein VGR07_12250 [Thermoanaerobaculia bacterium]|nr:hypothetical protein [Thermoanaerobaculia bacterium]
MKVLGNLSEWTSNPSGSTFRPLKVTFRVSPKTLTGLELDFWRLEVDF